MHRGRRHAPHGPRPTGSLKNHEGEGGCYILKNEDSIFCLCFVLFSGAVQQKIGTMPAAGISLDHEERPTRFGVVRRLPMLPPVAGNGQGTDASLDPAGSGNHSSRNRPSTSSLTPRDAPHPPPPLPIHGGGGGGGDSGALSARPRRKQYRKGMPIDAAVKHEFDESRRPRDDSSAQNTAIHGARSRKQQLPHKAWQSPTAVGAAAAEMQAVTSRQAGLDDPFRNPPQSMTIHLEPSRVQTAAEFGGGKSTGPVRGGSFGATTEAAFGPAGRAFGAPVGGKPGGEDGGAFRAAAGGASRLVGRDGRRRTAGGGTSGGYNYSGYRAHEVVAKGGGGNRADNDGEQGPSGKQFGGMPGNGEGRTGPGTGGGDRRSRNGGKPSRCGARTSDFGLVSFGEDDEASDTQEGVGGGEESGRGEEYAVGGGGGGRRGVSDPSAYDDDQGVGGGITGGGWAGDLMHADGGGGGGYPTGFAPRPPRKHGGRPDEHYHDAGRGGELGGGELGGDEQRTEPTEPRRRGEHGGNASSYATAVMGRSGGEHGGYGGAGGGTSSGDGYGGGGGGGGEGGYGRAGQPNTRRESRTEQAPTPSHQRQSRQQSRQAVPFPTGTPRSHAGYSHDTPLEIRPPHTSAVAMDATSAGITPRVETAGWSARTTRAGGFASIHDGATSLIMGEVESVLAETGLTAELMVDAGLSTEESKRLLNSLYVHSSGFLQLLGDTFAEMPHRQELLRAVWAGYATLIERADIGGVKEVTLTSAMAV